MENFRTTSTLVMAPADTSLSRIEAEKRKLKLHFPQFSIYDSGGTILEARGWLKTNAGNTYGILIKATSKYPYELPTVHPQDWTVKSGTPHLYQGGSLCIMRAAQWTFSFTIAFVVAKTALWLNKYEVFKTSGRWPGKGQTH